MRVCVCEWFGGGGEPGMLGLFSSYLFIPHSRLLDTGRLLALLLYFIIPLSGDSLEPGRKSQIEFLWRWLDPAADRVTCPAFVLLLRELCVRNSSGGQRLSRTPLRRSAVQTVGARLPVVPRWVCAAALKESFEVFKSILVAVHFYLFCTN